MDNVQDCSQLEGALDLDAMKQAVRQLAMRHNALRTCFDLNDQPRRQITETSATIDLLHLDTAAHCGDPLQAWQEMERDAAAEQVRRFDLSQCPVWSIKVFTVAPQRHVVVVTLSHLIADAQAAWIIRTELDLLYRQSCNDSDLSLPTPRAYVEHVEEQRSAVQRFLFGGATTVDHWREMVEYRQLGRFARQHASRIIPMPMAADREREGLTDSVEIVVPQNVLQQLRSAARAASVTLNVVTMAAWSVALHRWSHHNQIVMWGEKTVRSPPYRGTVGCFADPIIVVVELNEKTPFEDVVAAVDAQVGTFLRSHGQLVALVQAEPSALEAWLNSFGGERIGYQFFGDELPSDVTARLRPITVGHPQDVTDGVIDLHCCVVARRNALTIRLRWDTGLWCRQEMQQLADMYLNILMEIRAHHGTPTAAHANEGACDQDSIVGSRGLQ
jgi:Condensation domain